MLLLVARQEVAKKRAKGIALGIRVAFGSLGRAAIALLRRASKISFSSISRARLKESRAHFGYLLTLE
jgi:hypothetical protein